MEPVKVFIRRIESNEVVTFNNSNILKAAAEQLGVEVIDTFSIDYCLKQGTKNDIYIVTVLDDVIKLWLRGRRKICCWYQGIIPEESYMRHRSKIRFFILSQKEKFALKKCKINLLVSDAMLVHYNKRYHDSFDKKSYIFPCFNTEINRLAFSCPEKYENNYFVYAGGLQVWQCFEQTLKVYKTIEDLQLPKTKLIVMTKDQDFAKEQIMKYGIKNYEIGFTTPEKLPDAISKAKFGFVLREDTPVNRVSTPTKISTYLSCGIIPIYSSCINAFNSIATNMEYVLPWDESEESFNHLKNIMEKNLDSVLLMKDFEKVFTSYYSNDYHIKNISYLLQSLL